jgi:hypothetical protein
MAKESKAQQETVERVMHEFKEGELETRAGRKVKNRKQAIAIGLSEAGASTRQSPKQNSKRVAETRSRERRGITGERKGEGAATKAELYERARKQDIPGRSKMSKAQLAAALK